MNPTIQHRQFLRLRWLFIATIFLLPFISNAQTVIWAKTIQGGGRSSYGTTLYRSPSGQIIIQGYVDSSAIIAGKPIPGSETSFDAGRFFAGYNTNGDALWSFPYQCAGIYTNDGNYLFFTKKDDQWNVKDLTFKDSGTKILKLNQNHQTVEYNSLGRMLFPWHQTDQILSLQTDSANNIFHCFTFPQQTFKYNGITLTEPPGKDQAFLMKIGKDGKFRWIKEIVRTGEVQFPYFNFTGGENGCIYGCAAGLRSMYVNNQLFFVNTGNLASALFKLDSNGNFIWVKEFKTDIGNYGKLLPHPDGGFCISDAYQGSFNYEGLSLPNASNGRQSFIMRVLPDGTPSWASAISNLGTGYSRQFLDGFQQFTKGEFYLTGAFEGNIRAGKDTLWGHGGQNHSEAFIARVNREGKIMDLWSPGFGFGKSSIYLSSVLPSDSGELYCTGGYSGEVQLGKNNLIVKNNNPSSSNFLLFKLKLNFLHLPDSITAQTNCNSDTVRFRLHHRAKPDKVLWDFGDGNKSADLNPVHTYAGAGKYKVTFTAWFPDTIWRKQITVKLAKLPARLFSSSDTTFCLGSKVDFSHLNKDATYQWSDGDTQSVRSFPQGGKYLLTLSQYGCSVTDSFYVRLADLKANLGPDRRICHSDSVVLHAPSGPAQKLWSTGSIDSAIVVKQTGTYWLQLTQGGCIVRDEIHVQVDSAMTMSPIPQDTMICIGKPWRANLSGLHALSLRWPDGSTNDTFTISAPGKYSITVENTCGQFNFTTTVGDSDCVCRTYIPSAFSPDKDALNPLFGPQSYCDWESYQLSIYNRWGQRIWESTQPGQGWDGTCKGTHVPEGVYLYTLYYRFPAAPTKMERGTVKLFRRE